MASAVAVDTSGSDEFVRGGHQYRKDIDGLRACAVAPIVLFHAGISALPGGFIGVDVFFVISGFLITSIIANELGAGRFSLGTFYRRRVVRIFPALLTMLAIILPIGCAIMLPTEVADLGRSAAAAASFVANIFFFVTADYFAPSAETRPLLHTWSLGVEEQFYIFYPCFLLLIHHFLKVRFVAAIIAVVVASLACGAAAALVFPQAGFYLLPSRAWELGLGGLVALGAFPAVASRPLRSALALAGAGLLVMGYLVIRPEMGFPVPWALLPCMGCALLIAYGKGVPTEGLLSAAPMRAIGLISYSLYLWHWPIIAFYRLETGMHLDLIETVGLVAASLVAASLSYLLIERPCLNRFRSGRTRPILIVGILAAASLVGASALVALNASNWRSFAPAVERVAAYDGYKGSPEFIYQFRRGSCFRSSRVDGPFNPGLCLQPDPARRDFVLVGDSLAAQYWRALALRHPQHNMMQGTAAGCRPTVQAEGAERCLEVVRYVLGPLLRSGQVDTVILSGSWKERDVRLLRPTIEHIRRQGARAVVIGPTAAYDASFPLLLARAMAQGDLSTLRRHQVESRFALDRRMAAETRAAGGRYVSVLAIECPQERCRLTAPDGAPMQFDTAHLTFSGARWVVDQIPFE